MSDTHKDKPSKYRKEEPSKRKPKEGRRFESTKGRQNRPLKHDLDKYLI